MEDKEQVLHALASMRYALQSDRAKLLLLSVDIGPNGKEWHVKMSEEKKC